MKKEYESISVADILVPVGETVKISCSDPYTLFGTGEWEELEHTTDILHGDAVIWKRIG